MIDIPQFEKLDLYPVTDVDIDVNLLVRNHLLITTIDGKTYAVIHKEYITEGLSYLSKISLKYDICFLDDISYNKLYNRYLEQKGDSDLNENISVDENEELLEDDISLNEFLKTGFDILTDEESAPIIKFVNSLFYQAIKKRASDIHIETYESKGIVRFRIDGVLVKHAELDKHIAKLVINRIKVISNLDISEKRVPQDGRTVIKILRKNLDVRVSVLPVYYGERVVLRILMDSVSIPSLEELGFDKSLTDEFKKLLSYPHGMILVTGPTGSGKSTTLHSFLKVLATPQKNIITIEDPVEYKANNINQIQVNSKAGLTFASGLRSILRQDPDIIMVGEIRDSETATIAIQAALTGHLLFSTLHTNNTTATITRLIDMGIDDFLISSTLLGVLSQRLVRKLCPNCKAEDKDSDELKKEFGISKNCIIYTSKGCEECSYTGFKGRSAVGELFLMNDQVKTMLKEGAKDFEIRYMMQKRGMVLLSTKLVALVKRGVTSFQEALRVGLRE